MTWEKWKQDLEGNFGTNTWKSQKEKAILNDNFNPPYQKDVLTWEIKQNKRIRAFYPDSISRRIVEKFLFGMSGDIRNSVRSLTQGDTTWENFISAFQYVCKNNQINRNNTHPNNNRRGTPRHFIRDPPAR